MTIYAGTFLIALATLALEVTLTRILSVTTWYHLAFFAVSTAMLGMTAGATTVYLKPQWFKQEKLNQNIATACLGYAFSIPLSLAMICLVPLGVWKSVLGLFALVITTFSCALPFYFSGIVVAAVLTKCDLPIGKLYASDLIGASFGCLLVLGALEIIDAPSLILLCAPIGLLAGLCFAFRCRPYPHRRIGRWALVLFLLAVPANTFTPYGIRPIVVKGRIESEAPWLEK